jgi:hypothetical protein
VGDKLLRLYVDTDWLPDKPTVKQEADGRMTENSPDLHYILIPPSGRTSEQNKLAIMSDWVCRLRRFDR